MANDDRQGAQQQSSQSQSQQPQTPQSGQSAQTQQRQPQGAARTGAAASTAATASDRERGIETGRDSGAQTQRGVQGQRSGLTRSGPGGLQRGFGQPFALMQRMAEDMDRLFEQFGLGRSALGIAPLANRAFGRDLAARGGTDVWQPQIEVFQRGDQLVVRADVPGLKKEDLNVEIDEGVLTVSGERRDEHEERREGFFSSERHYGSFQRSIPLPEGVDASQVQAAYTDGVLEVTLPAPKAEQRQARRIQIR